MTERSNIMSTTEQLATELSVFATWRDDYTGTLARSAAELRRLEAVNAELLEALKLNAQALSWLAFGECRGFTDNLPTAIEATGAARAAIRARRPA